VILAMGSVPLMVASQSPFDHGWLATFCLVPWMIACRRSSPVGATMLGLGLGTVFALVAANWLVGTFESQGASRTGALLAALATAVWAKGLLFAGLGWLVARMSDRSVSIHALAAGLYLAGIESWMGESRWGLPLLLLGHSQLSVPGVAQLAVGIGVPGISGVLCATNATAASILVDRRRAFPQAIACVVIWASAAISGMHVARSFDARPLTGPKVLLVIQPMMPNDQRWEPAFQRSILEALARQTREALEISERRPDAILWPESVLTEPATLGQPLGRRLHAHVAKWRVPLVAGLVRRVTSDAQGRYRNAVVWWSPTLGPLDFVDKVRALPVVESSRPIPGQVLWDRLLGNVAGGPKVVEAEVARALGGEFELSPAICFEILFPRVVAARRSKSSVAIVNIADDSAIPGDVADAQITTAAAFRAIEQRLAVVRVSNGGTSVAIDPIGRTVAAAEPDRRDHFLIEVRAAPPPTCAEKATIVLLPLLMGLSMGLLFAEGGRRCERTRGALGEAFGARRLLLRRFARLGRFRPRCGFAARRR
jgi:apolipoprotein N-acyltransferase